MIAPLLVVTLSKEFCFFLQESEPISKYLSPEVPAAVKRRIARMGVDLLLKMVGEI